MLLTMPSASDETVTSSTAASVPTTSIERITVCSPTVSILTGLAVSSRPRAWALSTLEQPEAASAHQKEDGRRRCLTRVTHKQ